MLKKFFRGLTSTIFKLSIFFVALSLATVTVLGKPDTIKDAVAESGLYDSFVENAISSAEEEFASNPSGEEGQIAFSDPRIQQAAHTALPPETIREATESFIDGMYAWLQGNTEQPQFTIDLTEAKQTFAVELGNYAEERYSSLPQCTLEQLQTMDRNEIDPFTVPCQVPGVSAATAKQEIIEKVGSSDEVFGNPVITADTIKNENGENVFENTHVPGAFGVMQTIPWILGLLALVTGALLLVLHDDRRKGIKSIAVAFIGTGIFLGIGTLLLVFLFSRMNQPQGPIGQAAEGEFQESAIRVVTSVISEYNNQLLLICAAYIAIGAAILLALHFTKKPGQPKEKTEVETSSANNELPKAEARESLQDSSNVQTLSDSKLGQKNTDSDPRRQKRY